MDKAIENLIKSLNKASKEELKNEWDSAVSEIIGNNSIEITYIKVKIQKNNFSCENEKVNNAIYAFGTEQILAA